jgi:hypothetical protein
MPGSGSSSIPQNSHRGFRISKSQAKLSITPEASRRMRVGLRRKSPGDHERDVVEQHYLLIFNFHHDYDDINPTGFRVGGGDGGVKGKTSGRI